MEHGGHDAESFPEKVVKKAFTPVPLVWDPVFFLSKKRPSAVLVLFIGPGSGCDLASVVMIRRSTRVGSHRGQIGFPGGRLDTNDASPAATALREVHEELGLDPKLVDICGILDPVVALDGSLVYPVVGMMERSNFIPRLHQLEVQSLHEIPWSKLTADKQRKFAFNMFGCWRHSYFYDCGDINVWGLSAEIIAKASF